MMVNQAANITSGVPRKRDMEMIGTMEPLRLTLREIYHEHMQHARRELYLV